ncbi:hypothetical protein DERF_005979 [Dermatophagoides farinae]|uniref:Uncharacterized protein n=1 Tax=Dermatophagoides farinae TaxID=6954 RepID=A0A922L987_DERFA|nr:hypothetical protein DERF_005979 [Dermatophagoides farinae]
MNLHLLRYIFTSNHHSNSMSLNSNRLGVSFNQFLLIDLLWGRKEIVLGAHPFPSIKINGQL